jgi:hypothetical protein
VKEPAHILMGEMAFLGWLDQAPPGQAVVYHRGFLAVDRHGSACGDLHHLANRALWAAEHGLVDLVQRRSGPEHWNYLAVARRHTARISNLLGTQA